MANGWSRRDARRSRNASRIHPAEFGRNRGPTSNLAQQEAVLKSRLLLFQAIAAACRQILHQVLLLDDSRTSIIY